MSKTKVINLFGSAGAGKSTQAMGLVPLLRLSGYSAEYVSEYAKDVVYDENLTKLEDQLYIFAKQNRRIERVLKQDYDFIVTDSPLFLSYFYGMKYRTLVDGLDQVILNCINKSNNTNIFLERNHPYQTEGRVQTDEDSRKDSEILHTCLSDVLPEQPLHMFQTDGTMKTVHDIFLLITQGS